MAGETSFLAYAGEYQRATVRTSYRGELGGVFISSKAIRWCWGRFRGESPVCGFPVEMRRVRRSGIQVRFNVLMMFHAF